MALFYTVFVIAIQALFIHGESVEEINEQAIEYEEPEVLSPPDAAVTNINFGDKDFYDMFFGGTHFLYPSSSVSLMSQITDSDKSPEEQLDDIKEMAEKLSERLKHEMVNIMSYVLDAFEKENNNEIKGERKKRSVESPMDSTKMVMRLLKHIKSNNECQNMAIEKMMTAQEIAAKFGIEFNPDPEILTDLAISANNHAQDLADMLKDTCKNTTDVVFVPLYDDEASVETTDDVYYVYAVQPDQKEIEEHMNAPPSHEFMPELLPQSPHQHHHHHQSNAHQQSQHHHTPINNHHHHQQPMPNHPVIPETQIYPPPTQFCSTRNIFEPITPIPDVFVPIFEPITPIPDVFVPIFEPITTTIILPIEEVFEPEPELVGEEFEETISSKVLVDHDGEPGSSTVNHVMTYTVTEKAHYRTPQVETLPQQMMYSFYLM